MQASLLLAAKQSRFAGDRPGDERHRENVKDEATRDNLMGLPMGMANKFQYSTTYRPLQGDESGENITTTEAEIVVHCVCSRFSFPRFVSRKDPQGGQ